MLISDRNAYSLTHPIFRSIRRRALDLLYGMCDVSNAKDIVEELLQVRHWVHVKCICYFNLIGQIVSLKL